MIKAWVLLVLLWAVLPSCSNSEPQDSDTVVMRLSAMPSTLDPALITDINASVVASKLYNGLVKLDKNLRVVPDIASSWSVSQDAKNYEFKLKRGIKFSNGLEVTAWHFKTSFAKVLSPQSKSPNTWVFDKIKGAEAFKQGLADDIEGIKVLDNYTLLITLKEPFNAFLNMLTTVPAYVSLDSQHTAPIGTGPFKLKSITSDITLIRNDLYFDTPPKVKEIVYRVIPEDLTAVVEFELGRLDILTIPSSAYKRFVQSLDVQILPVKSLNTYYLGLNCSKPPFDDPVLRKAVFMAIDRQKILETFLQGRGRLAKSFIPEELRRWSIISFDTDYNPKEARRIFQLKKLQDVTFYINAEQEVIDLAEIIQSYLKAVGVNVLIKQLQWTAFRSAVNKGEPQMFWLSWWADYPDAQNFLFPTFHSSNLGRGGNRVRYVNREVDALILQGQHSRHLEDAFKAYQKAEAIILRDYAWIPFWHKNDYIAVSKRLQNVISYPVYTMDKGTDFYIVSKD